MTESPTPQPASRHAHRRRRGFTLLELLITLFIIGLLTAIAIPLYISQATRTKIAEAFALVAPVQRNVEEFWTANGDFPPDNSAAGSSAPQEIDGAYVDRVEVDAGVITARFDDPALAGGELVFTPVQAGNGLVWGCVSPNIPSNLLPPDCR